MALWVPELSGMCSRELAPSNPTSPHRRPLSSSFQELFSRWGKDGTRKLCSYLSHVSRPRASFETPKPGRKSCGFFSSVCCP